MCRYDLTILDIQRPKRRILRIHSGEHHPAPLSYLRAATQLDSLRQSRCVPPQKERLSWRGWLSCDKKETAINASICDAQGDQLKADAQSDETELKLRACVNFPMLLAGGEENILRALATAFPATKFRVREDAASVFVLYTANASGAPTKEEVRSILNSTFAKSSFKIPTFLSRG